MDLPVLLEPVGNEFRATLNQPLGLVAYGPTKETALSNLQTQLGMRLQNGAAIVPLPVGNVSRILQTLASMKPYRDDDPLIQEWKKAMEEYREQVENDPDYL